MNELEELILKMQQLGESEESIKLVIDNWNEIQESNVESEDVDEEPGKSTDPVVGSEDTDTDNMDLESEDFSSELPQVTKFDTRSTEEAALKKLRARFKGLNFTFEGTGATGDWITITAPADKDGNIVSEEFSFDKFWGNMFGDDKAEAEKINKKFI